MTLVQLTLHPDHGVSSGDPVMVETGDDVLLQVATHYPHLHPLLHHDNNDRPVSPGIIFMFSFGLVWPAHKIR